MILLGHRGARKYAPENTIAAFEQALADGCDGFEFDVRLTVDRKAVICHDPKLKRLEVARASYEQLRERCREVADLEEVISKFHDRAFLNIELKVPGAEELVLRALEKHPPGKGVVVSSFLPEVVVRLHSLGSRWESGLICENRGQLAKWKKLPVKAVMVERKLVEGFVRELKTPPSAKAAEDGAPARDGAPNRDGIPARPRIFVWTVNSAREMKKLAEMGVDGIISDDTKLLVETVG